MEKQTKRQQNDILRAELENERSSFMPHWRDLGDYIYPRRPRFTTTDVNKGDKRNQKIIDSTATLAARTLRSGMMGGVTSPARPWFRLGTPDPKMMEAGTVKEWLSTVSDRMADVFLKSNLYNVLPIVYGDMGVFATGAMMIEEDFEDVIRCYAFPIGSYMLAQNSKLKVDTFFRTFQMTVAQVVDKFALQQDGTYEWDNISDHVKKSWEMGQRQQWIEVNHVIKTNDEWRPGRDSLSRHKKFSSCYYESGVGGQTTAGSGYLEQGDKDKYLSEMGYDYFPVLAPRWEINGADVYGTSCPGMDALGDIKQLQTGEKRILQAIEKSINPPMVGSMELRNQKSSILPADITYVSMRDGKPGFAPAHEVDPRVREMEEKQEQTRNRIRRALFEDLFLMMAQSDRRTITAREVDERHEEKLLALGPVLEQLNQDALDPLIDITFTIMDRQGLIPPVPQELQGVPLKVQYISVMAQAQKLVSIAGIERFARFCGELVGQTGDITVLDKVDIDQMIDVYGDITSVAPGIVRSDEAVAEMKAGRVQQQKQAAMAENIPAAAGAMKDLSQADTGGDNALTRLMQAGQAGAIAPVN